MFLGKYNKIIPIGLFFDFPRGFRVNNPIRDDVSKRNFLKLPLWRTPSICDFEKLFTTYLDTLSFSFSLKPFWISRG